VVLALVIACVGLYGTVSYNAARRTGEIGIRMALGAQRGAVVWMIVSEVVVVAVMGLTISVPAALSPSQLIRSFLFGMTPNDPQALTLAVAILVSAALLAGYLPARRASPIDPMIALRMNDKMVGNFASAIQVRNSSSLYFRYFWPSAHSRIMSASSQEVRMSCEVPTEKSGLPVRVGFPPAPEWIFHSCRRCHFHFAVCANSCLR
jgi:hypothetical protein